MDAGTTAVMQNQNNQTNETDNDAIAEQRLSLGAHHDRLESRLGTWKAQLVGIRLWRKDPTLWTRDPKRTREDNEFTPRLGWLDLPCRPLSEFDGVESMRNAVQNDGCFKHLVLIGMGGSSLSAVVMATLYAESSPLQFHLLDSTHPEAIERCERAIDLASTLFLVASKSGTTLETLTLAKYFESRLKMSGLAAAEQMIAITDPQSELEKRALAEDYRAFVTTPADVGGRYSALTQFGLLPAALLGADVGGILRSAKTMYDHTPPSEKVVGSPAAALGAVLGDLATNGCNRLMMLASPRLRPMTQWIEQLIAESTGKDDKGIIPYRCNQFDPKTFIGEKRLILILRDRLNDESPDEFFETTQALTEAQQPLIEIDITRREQIGGEFYRWQIATALAASTLQINPFDEPQVALSKQRTRSFLSQKNQNAAFDVDGVVVDDETTGLRIVAPETVNRQSQEPGQLLSTFANMATGDEESGFAMLTYLPGFDEPSLIEGAGDARHRLLASVRQRLESISQAPLLIGEGPRYLHSSGQLLKGGPQNLKTLLIYVHPKSVGEEPASLQSLGEAWQEAVPHCERIVQAQAWGDYQAMNELQRCALLVEIPSSAAAELFEKLIAEI